MDNGGGISISIYIYIYIWYDIACISEKHQSRREIDPKLRLRNLSEFYKQDGKQRYTAKYHQIVILHKKIRIPWCVIIVPFHLQLFWVRCRAFRLLQAQHSPAPCDPWPGASKHEPSRSRTWWTSPSWPNLVRTGEANSELLLICPVSGGRIEKNMWCMRYIIYDLHDPMIKNTWDVPNKCQQSCRSAAYTWVFSGRQRMRADGQGPLNYNRPFNGLFYMGVSENVVYP